MDSDLKQSVARLYVNRIDLAKQVMLDNILSPLNVWTDVNKIENFNHVNTIIIMTSICILYLLSSAT